METLKWIFSIILYAGFKVTTLALWLTPLGVLGYIWGRINGAPITKYGLAILVVCLVEGGWFYATSVFHVPVPHWLDVIGQIGAWVMTVAIIIMTIINIGKDAKGDTDQKKDDAEKGEHREP